ncbi:MAG: SDR family NAD(P)-dependent oxidoreductase [Verrucomicrobiales bacterium]|nr:SDR family NAD(P)-dependent oxidoreductase [Verrucomicrobiales bacterium]
MRNATESRRIVITGVSRGCGRALAEALARAGHVVAGCATSAAGLEELRRDFGLPHRWEPVELTDDAAVAAWAERLLRDSGAPDLLVNNAAVINPNARLWEVSAADFGRVMDVNLKGVANVIRHFVPAMIAAGRGVVVNFSSGWGRSTSPEVAPYCASKWGIEGLTQALAQELPSGLAAVPVNPGIINTDMLRSCFGESARAYPTAAEWARLAVPFLLGLGPQDSGQPLSIG